MTDFPDHFVTVGESYGKRLFNNGTELYSFERENEQFDVVMAESGGCDGCYRPESDRDTYYHITVAYEIEAAVLPLIDNGWTLPEINANLATMALPEQLAILRERKSGFQLTTPDLLNNSEYKTVDDSLGREISRSGSLVVMMKSGIGEEFAVYETAEGRYIGCVMNVDENEIEWYEIEPHVGIESATKCWLDVGYDLVEYDEAAAVRINEHIQEAIFSKTEQ